VVLDNNVGGLAPPVSGQHHETHGDIFLGGSVGDRAHGLRGLHEAEFGPGFGIGGPAGPLGSSASWVL